MCNFPSKQLIAQKREMAVLADVATDPRQVQMAAEFCMKVDQLRLLHEDLTACDCWYSELKKMETVKA